MTLLVPGTDTWEANIEVPDDGDPVNGDIASRGQKDLANRTVWLGNRMSKVEIFTTPGIASWTIDPDAIAVRFTLIGGGGGGSGAPGADGGGGGGGGAIFSDTIPASELAIDGTVSVRVGIGGFGGTGTSSETTTTNGTDGGNTEVYNSTLPYRGYWLIAEGGKASAGTLQSYNGGDGYSGGGGGCQADASSSRNGGDGGVLGRDGATGEFGSTGGSGVINATVAFGHKTYPGTGGVAGGAGGGPGGGGGGGGGHWHGGSLYSQDGANGSGTGSGTGGKGGRGYGAGGGGGGGSVSGQVGGDGGDGAPGLVIIQTFYSNAP
jgi:hypothetical protein